MIHLTIYVLMTSPLLVATLAPMAFHYSGYGNPTESTPPKGNHVVPSASPITTTSKYTTISPIDHCRGQLDNYSAAEPGSKCRRYFRCNNNGRQSIYLCPGKLVFNGQRCVHPSEFHCHNSSSSTMTDPVVLPAPSPLPSPNDKIDVNGPKDCEGKSDGYYQDGESGCRSYFFCASGLKAIYVCPGKSVFDGQRCVEPETYKCPFSSSDCQGASNGYLADLSSGCRNYYFCSGDGHKLITLTCSDGRLFDGKKCVDPSQYRCPSDQKGSVHLDSYYAYSTVVRKPSQSYNPQTYFVSSRVNAGSTATTGQPPAKGDYCERNYGFFVVHGTGCRQYYLCIGGSRSDLQCSGDAVFNGQICVDPDQYICPESKSDCQGKTDGVYPDRLSGCRNYFLCLGQVQTNLSCPAGQLFDGRRCTDGRRVSCTDPLEGRSAMTSSPCSGRTNGLYPDPSFPGCRGYLYCRAGRPYGPAGRCSRSERFSGQHSRCLPKHEVECRSPEEDNEDEMDYMMAEGSALVTIIGEEDPAMTTAATTTN